MSPILRVLFCLGSFFAGVDSFAIPAGPCLKDLGLTHWNFTDRLLVEYRTSPALRLKRVGRLSSPGLHGPARDISALDLALQVRDYKEWQWVQKELGRQDPPPDFPAKLSLKDLLAEGPSRLTASCSIVAGPNCWNATLMWTRLQDEPAYEPRDRMLEKLARDFTRVPKDSALRFGDVIAVYGARDGDLQHTAIYINKDFLWHKASSDRTSPWTFDSLPKVLNTYYVVNDSWRERVRVEFLRKTSNSIE